MTHRVETGTSKSPLSAPWTYSWLQRLLGSRDFNRWFVSEQLRPEPGQRILDMGCGPGDIVALMPRVQYLGLDLDSRCVDVARKRFADRGRFLCMDVREARFPENQRFDLVVAKEVLHHLDDAGAMRVMKIAAMVLTDVGRLVTVDPALDDRQSPLARWLIQHDRGKHVRGPAAYKRLAEPWFAAVEGNVRDDLLRVPYPLAILACSKPRRPS
jgi:SAM-dependent methyltransferase